MQKNTLLKMLIAGMLGTTTMSMYLGAQDTKSQEAPPAATESAKPAEEAKPEKSPLETMPDVIAQFGDTKITKKEVLDTLNERFQKQGMDISKLPPELVVGSVYGSMMQQISLMLLTSEADKAGFKADKNAVVKFLQKQVDLIKKDNPAQYEQMVKMIQDQEKKTVEQYIEQLADGEEMQKMIAIQQFMESKIQITDKDIEEFYEKNKETYFKTPGDPADSVRVSHILIAVDEEKNIKTPEEALKKAEEIIAKLQKDAALFEALADAESVCQSGKYKGSLGVMVKEQGMFGKEFEDVVFALEVDKIYDKPVKTDKGYHVVRRDASVGPTEKKLDDPGVKDQIKAGLTEIKGSEFAKEEIEKAKKNGTLKLFIEEPSNPFAGMMQ